MSIFNTMLTTHMALMAMWLPGIAGALPEMDATDREILTAYLSHVESSGRYCTPQRMAGKDHSWRGGPVASGYFGFKYLTYPRWKSEAPSELPSPRQETQALIKKLTFQVKEPGYQAPMSPP